MTTNFKKLNIIPLFINAEEYYETAYRHPQSRKVEGLQKSSQRLFGGNHFTRGKKITNDVEENGQTFEENSMLKARFFCKLANSPMPVNNFTQGNIPVLADDGGLVIDALNSEPGVHSRRWKGYRMTDQEMVDYAIERMQGIPREKRTARMVAILSLVFPDGREYQSKAAIEGIISEKQETTIMPGYPFRSIFFVREIGKIFTDLTEEEHNRINHRIPAIKELSKYFTK